MSHQIPTFEPFEPRLLMSGTDTVDSLFASAEALDNNPGTTVSADGQLATAESSQMYSFTTKATGTISLALDSADGQLDPYLRLYDSYQRLLASNDDLSALDADSFIKRYVYSGQTFFVEVSGAGESVGDYSLSLTSNPVDDFSNTMVGAGSMYVSPTGAGTFTGTINYATDEDVVEYNATVTGRATVRLYSVSQTRSVAAFDAAGDALAVQQEQTGYWQTVSFLVTAGESYYVNVSDSAGTTGYFYGQVLSTIPQEFVDAEVVDVAGAESESVSGSLQAGESDMYRFTAQATGYFEINMSAAEGSSADPYLRVYNDQRYQYYYNDNAAAGTVDSRVRMYVTEGQTFYVRAAAGNTAGDYDITFTSIPTDDMANSMAAASAMYSSATGAGTKYGNIQYRGDADVMSYTVHDSGTVRMNLASYYGTLAGVVKVFDAGGNMLASQTAAASGSVDLEFSAVAGEQYFIQIEGAADSTGRYVLKVLPTIWQEFVDATEVDVAGAATETVSGTLSADGSTAYKITVPASGYFQINMQAADGSTIDSYLEVYNDAQVRVSYNDNVAYQVTDSKVRLYAREGQTFYVRASAAKGTEGDFSVTFESQPFDDAGNDAARAAAMYISATGATTKYANIQYGNDVDCYAYTAKYTGLVQSTVTAYGYRSLLEAVLTVRDAAGNEMGTAQATAGGSLNLNFTAVKGETYFFSVSGADSSLGTYIMKVLPTVWQEFVDATEVDVAGAASETETGTLGVDGSTAYKITVPASGYFQINMQAADGSAIDSYLEVYNEAQGRVAYNDNANYQTSDSQVRLYAREGQTFYVRASAAKGTAGDFSVTFESQPFDDAGNDAARAASLYVAPSGAFLKYGNIQYGNDVDCFSYTAKYTGLVQTTVTAYGYRSPLEAVLTVRDAAGNEMGTAQAAAGGSLNLNFTAIKGETYFFSVSGADSSLGMYNMKVLPTIWQEFVDATEVDVAGAASETETGTLGVDGSTAYKITVPASGYFQINMQAADGSAIDSYLEVYNEVQGRVSYNDNANYQTTDSQVRLYAREGQTFYVRASAAKGTAGEFSVTFESQPFDDAGNDAARAAAMYISATGAATKYANIQYGNDVDCYAYTAKHNGLVQTSVNAYGYRSPLAAILTVRDGAGNAMGTAQAAEGGALNLNFTANKGETYFFSVSGADSSLGTYIMKVLPTIWQEFIDATEVDVAGAATETVSGTLATDQAVAYSFTVPASGYFQINMTAADGSAIDSHLGVYNEAQGRVLYNDNANYQTTDSQVRLYAREGQTFYVFASAAKGTAGEFSVTFESQPFDDAGNDAARAAAMYISPTGSVTKYANIQYGNDVDCYAYKAKHSGLVQTSVQAYGYRSPLAAVLTVRDAAGNEMGTAQAAAGGSLNMNFTAVKGETYYFSVSGADSSLGMYIMKVLPTVWQDFIDATDVDVAGAATETVAGTLGVDEVVAYRFTVPASGYFQIDMQAADGSAIDSYLEVYNEAQGRVAYNDNATYQATDSKVRLYAREGQTFYVRASAAKGTEGEFSVTFESQPFDDAGNDAARAAAMYISPTGSVTKYANIQYGNDVDCYAYQAKHSGMVRTSVTAYGYRSPLEAVLTVRDAAGNAMGTAQAAAGGSLGLNFTAVEGETYYFSVSGAESTLGAYNMQILPTIWQDFIDATDVSVLGGDSETVSDTLEAGERATYRFTVPASGYFQIDMTAADGSSIDSYLEVYNEAQGRVSYNDNANYQTTDSRARVYAQAGQTYFVRASAAHGTAGEFSLTFESQPYDDFGNDAARAAALYVSPNGSLTKYGNIQYDNDTDCFAYTAKHSGLVQMNLAGYGYSNPLAPALTVRDAGGNSLSTAQVAAGQTLNMSFTAVAGETYFFSVSGADSGLGWYTMKVLPTVWQDFIDATEVTVAAAGEQTVSSSLAAGQYKSYLITAPAGGYMQFDMTADGSSIDSYVEIYNQDQQRLVYNDNVSASTGDSRIRMVVTEGQTFYVRCSSKATAGEFSVKFTSDPTDDVGNDMASAAAMAMAASGSASKIATVNYGPDVDVFEFDATVSGDMTVSMAKYGTNDLIGSVRAMDIGGAELAADDASDGTAQITFHVVAGETYFLSAASVDESVGQYVLTVSTEADVVPDPAPDPDPEPDPEPDPVPDDVPTPGAVVDGAVEYSGGVTRLVIAGTDGNDVITLSYDGSVTTLSSQNGTQTFAGHYENVSVYGFAGNDVIRLDYSLLSTCVVYAGDGNDKVYENSQGASTLYGGAGDDLLIAVGGGNDVIYGEAGDDSYWVDTTDTIGDATSAETSAKTVHRIASFYQPYSSDPASVDYISTDINAQSLRDPTAGAAYGNYSDRALFADGPKYNDIRQGAVGDCYYLASLAGLADTDPDLIRQAITDLGDGTYAVRFYRAGAEVYLRLDGDLPGASSPIYAKLSPDGETWVALMEKAYAFFRYGQNSYSSIEGGWMSTVVEELTGLGSETRWTGGSADSLASYLSSNLSAGHSVTLGSYSSSPSPIVGGHAYTVISVEGSGDSAYVTVYNPWGVDGRSYDSNYSDGLLRLSISMVQTCFSAAVVSYA